MQALERPNFFPGQLIDYKDFNRLAQQPDRVNSFMCQHLFPGGGIVTNSLEDFHLTPLKGLFAQVAPGVALLPTGQAMALKENVVIDLSQYQMSDTLIVSLSHRVRGANRFVDPKEPTIEGYKAETFEPELRYSKDSADPEGIELFRVYFGKNAKTIRFANTHEEWNTIVPEDEEAVVDLRHRRLIVPHTHSPIAPAQMIELRKALYDMESAYRRLARIFFLKDAVGTLSYLSQLHAELLSLPFQPLKVAFLASELSDKWATYLSKLNEKFMESDGKLDETVLIDVIAELEKLRRKDVIPKEPDLSPLVSVSTKLKNLADLAEAHLCLVDYVKEALSEVRKKQIEGRDTLILAGRVFDRVDAITVKDEERWNTQSKLSHRRIVQTRTEDGDLQKKKGVFIQDGSVEVSFEVKDADRPVVMLLPQYLRREGLSLKFVLNGRQVQEKAYDAKEGEDTWLNEGLVLPESYLNGNENRLQIILQEKDLDFGFFGLFVFQPRSEEII